MKLAIQVVGLAIGLPLQLVMIAELLRGGYRKYPLAFVYIILDFLTTVLEVPPAFDYSRGIRRSANSLPMLYWPIEGLMQLAVFSVVMSLIYYATAKLRPRRTVRAALIAGPVLFAGLSFLLHYNPSIGTGEWMTPWVRDLNFSSAILDLALWAILIGQRDRDPRLLMLSGGLGIQFTGDAIATSISQIALRNRSRSISLTGNALKVLSNLIFLYIWWQAFRAAKEASTVAVTTKMKKEPPATPGDSLGRSK